ncbi:MAG: hypothetical protein INR65_19570, partial [Gluconacetobacter diazotrophicus]|nr:hypothetical protein [Gluconacetobacter diazotrophicus]
MHARSLHPGSRSRAALPVAVLAGFVALSVAFCGRGADWTHRLLASSGGDAWSFVWFLNWWPWALFHGHGLLHSGFVYAPDGYDLSWATAVPTASLLALPVTLVFGADVSFNVLSALAPGLDGFSAFLLLRRCGATPIAGIAGGLVYGFSPFEAGQLQGHLNLDLTFPIPLACLLVVSRVQDRIGRRGFIAGLAATLLFEFGLSAEMFATFCCLGAGAWLLFVCLCRAPLRPVLLRAAAEAAVSLVVVAVLLLPWLLSMRAGAARIPGFNNPPWFYSTNLLNLIVPTRLTLLGGRLFA